MRKTLGICLLVLLLTGSVSAGEIPNFSTEPPPPPPANTVGEPTGGVMPNDEPTAGGVMGNDASDGLTQAALDLLALLPSLV